MLTRDERVDIFKHLHDLLWNGEGFDPTTSRNILLVLFSIRLIEEHSDKLGINEECRYSHLVKTIEDGESELIIVDRFMKIIQELRRNLTTSAFFINAKIVNGDILRKLILKIEEFSNEDLHSSDILGELYEVVGSGDKANSEIGQYFTSREICRFVVNTCIHKKSQFYKKINGERILKNFLDPFGGTGGFAREFVKRGMELGVNEWEKEIYVFDRNKNMIPIILLNLLFTTGKIFESSDGSIRSLDSFRDNIKTGKDKVKFPNVEYDFIFTNPPFGGDSQKDKGFTYSSSSGKGKDKTVSFEVNEDIRTIGIVDNDKVSAAVQLCMSLLAPKGICAAVLPQGFFFGSGKAKVELRKKLIEEYKVHMVVDIPQDAFLGTTTKTSILIFQKGGETEEIIFNNMQDEFISSATLEDLRKKNYSLNAKMYIEKEEIEIEGFEMMRLGDLLTFEQKKEKFKAGDGLTEGLYRFYTCSQKELYINICEYEKLCLIFNRGGSANIRIDKNFSISHDDIYVMSCDDEILMKYIYYFIKSNMKILEKLFNGSIIKHLNKITLENIEIPVPSIKKQNEIVEQIRVWDELIQSEKEQLKKMEKAILYFTKIISRKSPKMKLETACSFKGGKAITKSEITEGIYPVIGGGIKEMGFHNDYNQEPFTITISQVGANCGFISRRPVPSWVTSNAMIISSNSDDLNEDFLYYLLKTNEECIMSLGNGTAQPKICMKTLKELEFGVPPLEKQLFLSKIYQEVRNKMKIIIEYSEIMNNIIDEMIPKV